MADVTTPFGFPYPESTDLVRDGATDIEALAEGVNDQLALGFQFVGTRYYTSSGTFAKADPFGDSSFDGAKLRAIRVRLVGAGGGGGGAATTGAGANSMGGGGGGGAFADSFITNIAGLLTTETVTRGAGGSAGTGSPFVSGSSGGQSFFGSLVVAAGGGGGASGASAPTGFANFYTSTPGGGGSSFTADFGFAGGRGDIGKRASATILILPAGGTSAFSEGAGEFFTAGGTNGAAGTGHGNGGSGGGNVQSQGTARDGGAGANGIVIIDVFA